MSIVLASASPRRQAILRSAGISFEVVVPEVTELGEGEPREVVLENALRKARAGLHARPGALVVGCDTDVVLDGRVLGKPADVDVAREHLTALAGRTHTVLSGLAVVGPDRERSGVASTEVTFLAPDERRLELYLESGEWRDRAGGYAIQGFGSMLVARIDGDFSNVVGLPIPLLLELWPDFVPGRGRTSWRSPRA